MTRSFRRDVQVLFKMLANIDSVRDVIKRYNTNFNNASSNALFKNKDAFDLCSFYLAQFGEKVKLLTDSTRKDLNSVADLSNLKHFRNLIDHDYENVNKIVLQGYIQSLVSNELRNRIIKRIDFCQRNKR